MNLFPLIFSVRRSYAGIGQVTVRHADQGAAEADLLWLTRRAAQPGWGVQTPDGYRGTEWVTGQTLVAGTVGLTLKEAKTVATVYLEHGRDKAATEADPRYVAVQAALDKRRQG